MKDSTDARSLQLYWMLAAVRIILTLIPQTGYIHPDEYFQSIEVLAEDAYNIEASRPWEFNITYPIRSILLQKVVFGIPYILLQLLSNGLSWLLGWEIITAYSLVVVPRLVACALSFVTDYCLYMICVLYRQKYHVRLIILGSSYVMLVHGTRTLSNSIEMALYSFVLYLVAKSMLFTKKILHKQTLIDTKYENSKSAAERAHLFKMRASLPEHTTRHCFILATTLVAGVFNRPTFLAFGVIPVFFWLQRGLGSRYVGMGVFHHRMLLLVLHSLPAVCLFIIIDSMYYGYLTWVEIGVKEVYLDNFVVTPLNFVLYNIRASNLAEHGLHPCITHILVNIPLLYNVLGLVGLSACVGFFYRAARAHWTQLPRSQSIVMLMTGSFLVPVALLSLIPHQEPRFLIPVTLPLVFLHAQEVRELTTKQAILYHTLPTIKWISGAKPFKPKKEKKSNTLITLWIVINAIMLIFYGFLHQGGVYPVVSYLHNSLLKQEHPHVTHLVTSHTYSFPQSLLLQYKVKYDFDEATGAVYKHVPKKKFFLTEMGSRPLETVSTILNNILMSCSSWKPKEYIRCTVYLALPTSLLDEFVLNSPKNMTYKIENVFYPHLSTEAFPEIFGTRQKSLIEKCSLKKSYSERLNSNRKSETIEDCELTDEDDDSPIVILYDVLQIFKQLSLSLIRVQKMMVKS